MGKSGLWVIMLLVLSMSFASATTYYFSNSEGDDANDGLTEATPKKTLKEAARILDHNKNIIQPGDEVLFKRGDTWKETFTSKNIIKIFKQKSTEDDPLVVGAYGTGARPKFDVIRDREGTKSMTGIFEISGSHWVVIRDLELTSSAVEYSHDHPLTPSGIVISYKSNAKHILIDNMYIHDTRQTFSMYDAENVTIQNSEFRNNYKRKPLKGYSSGTWASGINDLKFINNIYENEGKFEDSGSHGLYISKCNNVLFKDNEVYHENSGFKARGTSNAVVEGNYWHDSNQAMMFGTSSHEGKTLEEMNPSDNWTVRNNFFNENGLSLLLIDQSLDPNGYTIIRNVEIYNNIFANKQVGIKGGGKFVLTLARNSKHENINIHHNVFYNTRDVDKGSNYALSIGYAESHKGTKEDIRVYNNIFMNPDAGNDPLILLDDIPSDWVTSGKIVFDNNLYSIPSGQDLLQVDDTKYDDLADLQAAFAPFDANSIEADPLFVDASSGDFHLQASSPAIDAGTLITSITQDYYGNARFELVDGKLTPVGASLDIGVAEYGSTGGVPAPSCGDSVCNGVETCSSCSQDCGICSAPAICGDGKKEGNEQCDDGNTVSGDGCSATCQTEDDPDHPDGLDKTLFDKFDGDLTTKLDKKSKTDIKDFILHKLNVGFIRWPKNVTLRDALDLNTHVDIGTDYVTIDDSITELQEEFEFNIEGDYDSSRWNIEIRKSDGQPCDPSECQIIFRDELGIIVKVIPQQRAVNPPAPLPGTGNFAYPVEEQTSLWQRLRDLFK